MAKRKPKLQYSIICDDIRMELGNKTTWVGIYQQNIIVSKLPFSFPKLCFVLSYGNLRAKDSFNIRLLDSADKPLGKAIKGEILPAFDNFKGANLLAIYSPLKVELEGEYKLVVVFNEDEEIKQEIKFNIVTRQSKESKP